MIKRGRTKCDINQAFFPVETTPVYWKDGLTNRIIPGQRVVLDVEYRRPLGIVSDQYAMVTNKDAVDWADFVVQRIFPEATLSDFSCFNILMPKTRSFCRIDLIISRAEHSPFPDFSDPWTPFIRITNSYNKTYSLKYEVGFCRSICLNGVIFGQRAIKLSITHSGKIDPEEILRQVYNANDVKEIETLWKEFDKKMQRLINIAIPDSMALPVFCKAFDISVKEDKLSDKQKESLGAKANQIEDSAKEYFAELGNNAYALMNVLTDFASYPEATPNASTLINTYQKKVGVWVDNIVAASYKSDFNLYDYIGKDAMNTALFLETLIKK